MISFRKRVQGLTTVCKCLPMTITQFVKKSVLKGYGSEPSICELGLQNIPYGHALI